MGKHGQSRRHKKRPSQKPHVTPDAAPPEAPAKGGDPNAGAKSCAFNLESLEPRILLSGTWVGTEGDDTYLNGNGDSVLHGNGGNDILHGEHHNDTIFGGAGNDTLLGGQGDDVLDGGTGDDSLFGGLQKDVLISGGGNDYLDGGMQDDTFRFTGAQNGDVITVEGGQGNDTVDLSEYTADQVSDDGSTIQVDLGGGNSFTIHHSNVENIMTAPPANTAPTATDAGVTLPEDASVAIQLTGSDPDAGDAVEQYRIDSLPDHGTLQLNGQAVSAGTVITQAQIDNGDLVYTPDANWHGSSSLSFSSHDGEAWSAQSANFSINVDPVNDAPAALAGSVTVNEDSSAAIHLTGSDPDAGDAVEQYRIDSLPDHGTLQLNGQAVGAGTVITQAQIDNGDLVYTPDANWHGSSSLSFSSHDGEAWSAQSANFSINVDPVNDAPAALAGSVTVNEDSSAAIHLTGSDPDAGDAVEQYRIDSLPDHGTLQLNGQAVSAGTVITQAQIDNGDLVYTPDANWHGSSSLSFSTHDGEAWSSSSASFEIQVTPVNDAVTLDAATPSIDAEPGESVQLSIVADDPDNDQLAFQWTQVSGPAVQLDDAASAAPSFTSPDVTEPTTLTFEVTVSDGFSSAVNTIQVTVHPLAQNPPAPPPPAIVSGESSAQSPQFVASDNSAASSDIVDSDLHQDNQADISSDHGGSPSSGVSGGGTNAGVSDSAPPPFVGGGAGNLVDLPTVVDSLPDHVEQPVDSIPFVDQPTELDSSDTVTWNGDEQLQILNPVDSTDEHPDDAAPLDAFHLGAQAQEALDDIQNVLARDFEVTGELVLPGQQSLTDAIDALVASVGRGTVNEVFVEVPLMDAREVVANADHANVYSASGVREQAMLTDRNHAEEPGRPVRRANFEPGVSAEYGITPNTQADRIRSQDPSSLALEEPAPLGFFARVWGAISALGLRSDDKQKN